MKTLVALGKNCTGKINGERLSTASLVTAYAAGELYSSGEVERIVFSGGDVLKLGISEADAMGGVAQNKYSIPNEALILEDYSICTRENARNTRGLLNDDEIFLLTINAHLTRARKLFENEFQKVHPFSAEDVLKGFHPKYYGTLMDHNTEMPWYESAKEWILVNTVKGLDEPLARMIRK